MIFLLLYVLNLPLRQFFRTPVNRNGPAPYCRARDFTLYWNHIVKEGPPVTEKELELLRKSILFRNMTDEEVKQAVAAMSPHRVRYPKRAAVAQDGDPFPEIGIVLSGSLHLAHIDSNGNSNLLYVLNPGDAVGELNAVGRYRLHMSISTEEPTEILYLSVDQLLRENVLTAPTQIRFLQNLTLSMAQEGQYLTRKLEDNIRRTMRQKVQDYLSAQYHKGGNKRTFVVPLNRQEMADFLFADRTALSYELCKMRDEGLLQFDRSRFELLVEMPITEDEPDPNDE